MWLGAGHAVGRIFLITLTLLSLTCYAAAAATSTALYSVYPTLTPTTGGGNLTVTGRFTAAGGAVPFWWSGSPLLVPNSGSLNDSIVLWSQVDATSPSATSVQLTAPAATGGEGGVLLRGLLDASTSPPALTPSFVSIGYYDPASLQRVDIQPRAIQVLGFTPLTIVLLNPVPFSLSTAFSVQFCTIANSSTELSGSVPGELGGMPAPSDDECVIVPSVVADSAYAATTLQFMTPAFVGTHRTGLHIAVSLSVNSGANWHLTNVTLTLLPAAALRAGIMYSFPIANDQWVTSHNRARFGLEAYLGTRLVDEYVEDSFMDAAGNQIDHTVFEQLITQFRAKFMIVTGTEYKLTAAIFAAAHPDVNMILFSSLRTVLPPLPNMAFATGRMYEVLYLAGMAAGSVTKTNRVGCVMLMPHPTVRAMCNGFALGVAQTAPTATVVVWNIARFQDPWVEENVGLDLTRARGCDVIVSTANGNEAPTVAVAAGGYGIGFNNDLRAVVNDRVIVSVAYEWEASYKEFATRLIRNVTFGPETLEVSLAEGGVSITAVSPVVPGFTQSWIAKEKLRLSALPWTERVFCASEEVTGGQPIKAANGTVMIRSGECLSTSDYLSFDWMVSNVQFLGLYEAPLQYTIEYLSTTAFTALIAIGCAIVAFEIGSVIGIIRYRDTPIFRAASPNFCVVTNCGAILFVVAGILFGVSDVSDDGWTGGLTIADRTDICRAKPFLLGSSFVIFFGPILVKTYRLATIFNTDRLQIVRITDQLLWASLTVMLGVELLIDLLWAITSPLSSVLTFSPDGRLAHYQCTSDQTTVWLSIALTYKFVLLAAGVLMAIKGRHLPTAFNETQAITAVVYSITFLCIVIVPLSTYIVDLTAFNTLVIGGTLFVSCLAVTALFATNLWTAHATSSPKPAPNAAAAPQTSPNNGFAGIGRSQVPSGWVTGKNQPGGGGRTGPIGPPGASTAAETAAERAARINVANSVMASDGGGGAAMKPALAKSQISQVAEAPSVGAPQTNTQHIQTPGGVGVAVKESPGISQRAGSVGNLPPIIRAAAAAPSVRLDSAVALPSLPDEYEVEGALVVNQLRMKPALVESAMDSNGPKSGMLSGVMSSQIEMGDNSAHTPRFAGTTVAAAAAPQPAAAPIATAPDGRPAIAVHTSAPVVSPGVPLATTPLSAAIAANLAPTPTAAAVIVISASK